MYVLYIVVSFVYRLASLAPRISARPMLRLAVSDLLKVIPPPHTRRKVMYGPYTLTTMSSIYVELRPDGRAKRDGLSGCRSRGV